MYSITEKTPTVGSTISRDNGSLWIDNAGETTPCSDMAAQFETRAEAKMAAKKAGITIGKGSWWTIVRNDD